MKLLQSQLCIVACMVFFKQKNEEGVCKWAGQTFPMHGHTLYIHFVVFLWWSLAHLTSHDYSKCHSCYNGKGQ